MNEHGILAKFRKEKIMTIEKLTPLFQCSMITVRRRLKKWGTFTSINQNGRYYTLPEIPEFDENGLWKYRLALFSKHGNLKQTIIKLIRMSESGLTTANISRIVGIPSSSSYFSQLKQSKEITREKHKGKFVYFSGGPVRHEQQKARNTEQGDGWWPTDAQAVQILICMIKNPGIEIEQLAIDSAPPDKRFDPVSIKHFLQFYDLLKKTPGTRP